MNLECSGGIVAFIVFFFFLIGATQFNENCASFVSSLSQSSLNDDYREVNVRVFNNVKEEDEEDITNANHRERRHLNHKNNKNNINKNNVNEEDDVIIRSQRKIIQIGYNDNDADNDKDDWFLFLDNDMSDLFPYGVSAEWINDNNNNNDDDVDEKAAVNCIHMTGTVNNGTPMSSTSLAVITICNQHYISGMFSFSLHHNHNKSDDSNRRSQLFFIEPSSYSTNDHSDVTKQKQNLHRIYKRSMNDDDQQQQKHPNDVMVNAMEEKVVEEEEKKQWKFFNLTGDIFDDNFDDDSDDGDDVIMTNNMDDSLLLLLDDLDDSVVLKQNVHVINGNGGDWKRQGVRGGRRGQEEQEIINSKIDDDDDDNVGYFVDTAWQPSLLTTRKSSNNKNNVTTSATSFTSSAPTTKQQQHQMAPPSSPPPPPQRRRRWLEIAIVVDHTVIAFHGRARVVQYVLTLMNIVNAIYQDPSLDANMQLVVTRLLLYDNNNDNTYVKNKRESVLRPGNAKRSLENVNLWNRHLHLSLLHDADDDVIKKRHHTPHDIAIWLTRADIGGPSGYAPVGGACDPERSCALNRDEGLTSAFIIAHEMAHILGLSHDGDRKMHNDCGEEALRGSVMAPMVSATFHQFLWSECSRREFARKASKWKCLLNAPPIGGASSSGDASIRLNATLQQSFSMDEQCRMEFGDGYELCRSFDIVEPCAHLWCGHTNAPLVCKTKKGPPLEGTACAVDRWCVNGYCVRMDRFHQQQHPPTPSAVQFNKQDGAWGPWTKWGRCSRTCGTGVEFRTRRCDNPAPIYGGSNCFGLGEEWRICNRFDCPEPVKDIRAEQCRRLPKLIKLRNANMANMTWLPYESDENELKCKLICTSKETNEVYKTDENLVDGTPCSYDEENKSNICIQGVCHVMGCGDAQLFSTTTRRIEGTGAREKEDVCGVCNGANTTCTRIETSIKRRCKRSLTRLAILPRHSRHINLLIRITPSTTTFTHQPISFLLKDRARDQLSLLPNITSQIIQGTKFHYKRMDEGTHRVWGYGPILSELAMLIKFNNRVAIVLGEISYYVANKMINEEEFRWIVGGWGPCTKSCGGGRRFKTKACWCEKEGRMVPRKFCHLVTRPNVTSERCNTFSCNFTWIPGEWEACSKTCGEEGMQTREVYCIPQQQQSSIVSLTTTDLWRLMVAPDRCAATANKPESIRPCNRGPCPSYWAYTEWTQCTASCGSNRKGHSTREVYCMQPPPLYTCNSNSNQSSQPPKNQTIECETTNEEQCRNTKRRCVKDMSVYCGISLMQRYCHIKKYKQNVCCKSCQKTNESKFTQKTID